MKKISKNLKDNNPNIPSMDKTNNEITLKAIGGQRKREWFGIDFNQDRYYDWSGNEVPSSGDWWYYTKDGMLYLRLLVSGITFVRRPEKEILDGYIGSELSEEQFFDVFRPIVFDDVKTVDGNDYNTLKVTVHTEDFPLKTISGIVYNSVYDLNSVYNNDFNGFRNDKYKTLITIETNDGGNTLISMASNVIVNMEMFLTAKGVIGYDWITANENAEEIYHTMIRMISGSDVVYKKSFDGVSRYGTISFNINYSD